MGCFDSVPDETSIHQFTVIDSRGMDVNLDQYRGKILLIVNVASKCVFSGKSYTQLTQLYNKYGQKGFEILAFSCNQFLRQEPAGTNDEIRNYACTRFLTQYPIMQKVDVNGPDTAPLYRFLKASKPDFLGQKIKWNFTKFLVDTDGKVLARFSPINEPLNFEQQIQKALGKL